MLAVLCFITGKLETLFITYLIMLIHETAHLLAALWLGLRPSHFCLYAFGVNLKLKNSLVCSLADEVVLYLSGPLSNLLMAGVSVFFFRRFFWYEDFYWKNIILCIINLLPILPLDGGVLLKNTLTRCIGNRKTVFLMRTVSAFMVGLSVVLICFVAPLRHNFSFYFFAAFLAGNLFTAKEKYNPDFLRALAFTSRDFKRTGRIIVMKKQERLRDVLKEFTNIRYNILCVIGENGEIEKIMSEREVIDSLMANK